MIFGKYDIISSSSVYPKYDEPNEYIHEADLDCVEIDKNLQAILRDKVFRVVHDDFLTYHTNKRYEQAGDWRDRADDHEAV